eukprot:911358-Pyramimonas_sp.AAC.1
MALPRGPRRARMTHRGLPVLASIEDSPKRLSNGPRAPPRNLEDGPKGPQDGPTSSQRPLGGSLSEASR